MSRFELILAAFRSGQMTDAQFLQHLAEDQLFNAWYKRQQGK